MQINFYITKEGMIDLYNWIKREFPNLLFYSYDKNACFDENELYINDDYGDQLWMTLNDSLLAEKMKANTSNVLEEKFPFLFQQGMEFDFRCSDNKIFDFDFSNYNLYKDLGKPFYKSRKYVDSWYLGKNERYTSIYQKMYRKIRKESIKLNGLYVKDYLYKSKNSQ